MLNGAVPADAAVVAASSAAAVSVLSAESFMIVPSKTSTRVVSNTTIGGDRESVPRIKSGANPRQRKLCEIVLVSSPEIALVLFYTGFTEERASFRCKRYARHNPQSLPVLTPNPRLGTRIACEVEKEVPEGNEKGSAFWGGAFD
jgi:hypothetical protein